MAKLEDILEACQTNITEENMRISNNAIVVCKPTDLT